MGEALVFKNETGGSDSEWESVGRVNKERTYLYVPGRGNKDPYWTVWHLTLRDAVWLTPRNPITKAKIPKQVLDPGDVATNTQKGVVIKVYHRPEEQS